MSLFAGAVPKLAPGALPVSPGVVIIGAGAAGIEAAGRIGGRAFTERAIFGTPYDHGCASLQESAGLPQVPFARQIGFTLLDHSRAHDGDGAARA